MQDLQKHMRALIIHGKGKCTVLGREGAEGKKKNVKHFIKIKV